MPYRKAGKGNIEQIKSKPLFYKLFYELSIIMKRKNMLLLMCMPAVKKWIDEVSALIKPIDKKHLVTTGNKGAMARENLDIFETAHSVKNI